MFLIFDPMFHYADSGFGNIVYIVLAIVYLLYNLLGAGKKKNKYPSKQEQGSPGKGGAFDLEKWVREQVEEKQTAAPPITQKQNKIKPATQKSTPQSSVVNKHQRMHREVMRVESTRKAREPKKLEVIELEQQETLINGISARDAIIASEILKRPEYI